MKNIIFYIILGLFGALARAEAPIEQNVRQLLAENVGRFIEVQNVPHTGYIAQGKNFSGRVLSETGLWSWCQVSSSHAGSLSTSPLNLQPGDKLFIFRASSSLANGLANYNSEAANIELVGVRNSKIIRIDLDCEAAFFTSISTQQLNDTLRNYFSFTGKLATESEKQEVIRAVLGHDDGDFYGKEADEKFVNELENK